MNRRAQAHAYPCSSSSSRQITSYLYAIALQGAVLPPCVPMSTTSRLSYLVSLALSLAHGPWPIPRPRPRVVDGTCNGRVAALGLALVCRTRAPNSPNHSIPPSALHSLSPQPNYRSQQETRPAQPTQQMPQLTDDNRATTRCPLLCAVALCAACRHSQLRGAARLLRRLAARLPGPKCATCATACYKCQSAAKCDVPLCPSLCPSLPVCQSRS
jgi:hypothetical protein